MNQKLTYDWNQVNDHTEHEIGSSIELCDETLRDGLQSPSVIDPTIEQKYELITLMDKLGIHIANIGLPGAGPRAYQHTFLLAQYVSQQRLAIKLNCAARTHEADILPIAEIAQKAGIAITAYCFLGTSPIRQLVEDWSLDKLKKTTKTAIDFAHKHGLSVAFVTEDTTRSDKNTLTDLFNHAISLGIERLVLCDTVGHATPKGVKNLISFTKKIITDAKQPVAIDWHGHNDRGLALINAIYAVKYGANRIHGTALGIGERVGNTSLDQLIVNLKLMGHYHKDINYLTEYVEKTSSYCHSPIHYNYPVFGKDAFRTATGVHAAAIIKAKNLKQEELADTVYSSVPARWFSKKQIIDIGPMSGASNIKYFLQEEHIPASEELIKEIFTYAKSQESTVTREDLFKLINKSAKGFNRSKR